MSYPNPAAPSPEALAARGGHVHAARRIMLQIARGLTYFVYLYVLFVEVILALGFFLLLAGANPTSPFVEWVYRSLDRVMEPFRGIFTPIELGTTAGNEVESIFETSVLFAMIIYLIVAMAINAFIEWLSGRIQRLDAQNLTHYRLEAYEQAVEAQAAAITTETTAAPTPPGSAAAPTSPDAPPGPGPA